MSWEIGWDRVIELASLPMPAARPGTENASNGGSTAGSSPVSSSIARIESGSGVQNGSGGSEQGEQASVATCLCRTTRVAT